MSIGEVARLTGLRPSAIRYYEKLGLLLPPPRSSGQRRYGPEAIERLALIRFARQTGFTMADLKRLVRGFPAGTPASARWRDLARRKISEMDDLISRAKGIRMVLERVLRCECGTLEDCGRILAARRR